LFLRNAWYAAIWSNDLRERPVARTIIGEKLVLFRGAGQIQVRRTLDEIIRAEHASFEMGAS